MSEGCELELASGRIVGVATSVSSIVQALYKAQRHGEFCPITPEPERTPSLVNPANVVMVRDKRDFDPAAYRVEQL